MKHLVFTLLVVFFSGILNAQKNNPDGIASSYSSGELHIQPKYGEGLKDLYDYIHSNLKVPEKAGKPSVFLTFIVEKDGTLTSIKATPADGPLNAEAIRVIELTSGKWSPGKKEGNPVRSYFTLPIKINIPRPPAVNDQSEAFSSLVSLDVQPEYPGGLEAFYKFVGNNFRTPEVDEDLSVKVFISFIVEKDGTVSNIKTLKDPGYGLGYEAEKVLYNLPEKWSPGMKDGNPVRTLHNLPIHINITK